MRNARVHRRDHAHVHDPRHYDAKRSELLSLHKEHDSAAVRAWEARLGNSTPEKKIVRVQEPETAGPRENLGNDDDDDDINWNH